VKSPNRGLFFFIEEISLLYELAKWLFLAIITGVVVGSFSALFLRSLEVSSSLTTDPGLWRLLLLPAGLLASVFVVRLSNLEGLQLKRDIAVQAVHRFKGHVPLRIAPVKMVASILTIASGGSAGRVGPCAQIGAALMSGVATSARFNKQDRRKLVVCGISAGFAAVFGTPVAGAVFGLEVLFMGQILYDVLLPSFISGIVSYRTALFLGTPYDIAATVEIPAFSLPVFAIVIVAGVFFGFVSLFHIEMLSSMERLAKKITLGPYIKTLIGSAVLILVWCFFGNLYLGLGESTIIKVFRGGEVPLYAFAMKSFTTGVTLAFGGTGGVLTPTFFVGTAAGAAFASFFSLDPVFFGVMGFVGVLAGSANTPIAAIILATELFGNAAGLFAAVVSVISFALSGHRSLYPSQILARSKSPALALKQGQAIDEAVPRMGPFAFSLSRFLERIGFFR
jgi:H+/Cl- antiporter ClcA